jgi:hypothetical protein
LTGFLRINRIEDPLAEMDRINRIPRTNRIREPIHDRCAPIGAAEG